MSPINSIHAFTLPVVLLVTVPVEAASTGIASAAAALCYSLTPPPPTIVVADM
jgi:hypothetical protein